MSEWHEERYEARNEALAEARGDCEEENIALDDEIKELKQYIRSLTNAHNRNTQIVEDLRKKLLERDERLAHLEYLSEPCREELERITGGDNK